MFFKKGKGHFCPKNKAKKDTSVFSKNPKDTSVPTKGTSDFKRALLSVSFQKLENMHSFQAKDTPVPPKDTSSPKNTFFFKHTPVPRFLMLKSWHCCQGKRHYCSLSQF